MKQPRPASSVGSAAALAEIQPIAGSIATITAAFTNIMVAEHYGSIIGSFDEVYSSGSATVPVFSGFLSKIYSSLTLLGMAVLEDLR